MMANSAGTSRVNQLVQLAKATFSHAKHEPGFSEHLEKLKKFVSTCTGSITIRTWLAWREIYNTIGSIIARTKSVPQSACSVLCSMASSAVD
jgi:hypothetical protein